MKPTKKLFQWDINQILIECTGKHVDYVIDNEVYRVMVVDGECRIPDELFQTSGLKTVYETYADGTYSALTLDISGRPMPPSYIFTPTQKETFDSLIERVDNAIADLYARAESGEFDGKDGKDGKDGLNGKDGKDGYTPVRGVDYMTSSDINQMEEAVSSGAIGTFNQNVTAKTTQFNSNSVAKTTEYNQNASSKTQAYNSNALTQLNAYNQNATTRLLSNEGIICR